MSAAPGASAPGRRGRIASAATDSLLIGWRNLKRIPRIPELAIFAILQSIMFVLLFAFVFGGAIAIPGGGDYKSFLMPGIFAQTIVFAAGDHGDRHDRRRREGHRRPLPVAADRALGGAHRPDVRGRHLQRRDPVRADGHRASSSAGGWTPGSGR